MRFKDREDAGNQLAEKISFSDPLRTIVLALPRGGIPLGIILTEMYSLSFGVVLAKKIGHPFQPEYAIGAIAEGGDPLFNEAETEHLDSLWIKNEVARIRKEMQKRRSLYSRVVKKQSLNAKDVILVDDGIATGMTMFAAIEAIKKERPNSIAVAVPVIPNDTYHQLIKQVDRVYAVDIPVNFLGAVGAYYQRFPQIEDKEVQLLIQDSQIGSKEYEK